MSACPTCRGQITGTTELFGACSWLADMFETIEAVTCNGTGGDGIAMRARADGRQELAADDVQRLEPAISAAEKVPRMYAGTLEGSGHVQHTCRVAVTCSTPAG